MIKTKTKHKHERRKALSIHRETVRTLERGALAGAAAGVWLTGCVEFTCVSLAARTCKPPNV